MATSYLNLIGKARFIHHIFTPDDAFGASKYKAGIWLDEANYDKYRKSGIQAGYQDPAKPNFFGQPGDPTKLKEDQEGPYVVLSRDDAKPIGKQMVYFLPPYIKNPDTSYRVCYVDENNEVIRQYQDPNQKSKIRRLGETFRIGNGSLVELNVAVFDTKFKGKGHRLEGIRILDLIEYVPNKQTFDLPAESSVPFAMDEEVVEVQEEAPKKKKAKAF